MLMHVGTKTEFYFGPTKVMFLYNEIRKMYRVQIQQPSAFTQPNPIFGLLPMNLSIMKMYPTSKFSTEFMK